MAAHEASSSSSSGWSYEVFLSFHGEDVRTNFADHLYHALIEAGIRTFRDDEELSKGKDIAPELHAAIQQSRISIPIFSKKYASSKWCLNELHEISDCIRTINQIVLPIFYKVEPTDVRNQTGSYAKAFEKHQECFDETTVQKWRNALKVVGKLDGWHSKKDMYEGRLLKEVVKTVWSTLNKRLLNVSNKKLVGIQPHIKEMLMLLDIESDDRKIVGIHGLGGIGKTTIARRIYDIVLSHFEGYTFIENVRENAEKHGIHYLQNQLIKDILKQENQNIFDVDTGIKVIQQRFSNKKVLIVLDDVDQDIQAKSLVRDREWFGIGSKIIITSRNKDILNAQKADGIYEPNVMDFDDSLELFSHYAFGRDRPLEDYLDLSKALVKSTGGLPLALQVIGSSLFKKEKSVWKGMLKKLEKFPNDDVIKRLKISYQGLEYPEQQMFLDAACFFIGMNKDIACHIWEGCGFSPQVGLDVLCAKSLITISEDGKLKMHDMLRDLGRDIVRQESPDEPGKRSRIWSQEEVLEVLDTQMGTSNVKGLGIDFSHISRSQCLMSEGFATMTRLRLLQVDYAHFCGNSTNSFSELRWLSWKGHPNPYTLIKFCPRKLLVLDLSHSKITKNWMGWNYIKMAENLKVINLTSCHQLSSTPDISANRLLEVLILEDSENLEEIDTSICCLTNLVILDMSGCIKLESLPNLPSSLTILDISHCSSIRDISGLPSYLTSLDVSHCSSIQDISDLPSCLTRLNLSYCSLISYISSFPSSLTSLDVSHCYSIRRISGLPSSLTSLHAIQCRSLIKLSSTSRGLRNLNTLCLDFCYSLEEIEGVDEKLDTLEDFNIRLCEKLRKLPTGLKNLRTLKLNENDSISDIVGEGMDSLEVLEISYCKSLRRIPFLHDSKRLRILQIRVCPNLSEIERLEDYESLQKLSIVSATSLKKLSDISTLKNLSYLRISECYSMEGLPDLSNLKELRQLEIEDWRERTIFIWKSGNKYLRELTEIPGLDRLDSLQKLKIGGCKAIKRLPDLSNLQKLFSLKIEGCKNLIEICGVDQLEFLEKLDVSGCESLERLPDLSKLQKLHSLKIEGCKNQSEIHGIDRLEILKNLDIRGCESLARLPNLHILKNLICLRIEGCKILTEIHGNDKMEFLEHLYISECESLDRLLDLSNLIKLKYLRIKNCENLTEIHGIDRLELLENLNISGCDSLKRLPVLSNLKNLKELRTLDCMELTEIQADNGLESLELLDVRWCMSLKKIPALAGSKNLRELNGVRHSLTSPYEFQAKLESLTDLIASRSVEPVETFSTDDWTSDDSTSDDSNSELMLDTQNYNQIWL